MESIIQKEKECYVCHTTLNLHKHHIYGAANRKLSEKYGCWCYLCAYHHNMSGEGIHFNKPLDLYMKKITQEQFEGLYGANMSFQAIFGRNFK